MSDRMPSLPPVDPSRGLPDAASLTPELLASLLVEGDDDLATWVLRHALAEAPRADVFDRLVAPAMGIVGDRWRGGRWSVADEHLASRTLLRALENVRPAMDPSMRAAPLAVLAGAAGEQHMLGLACLEQVLGEVGWQTANLGADVPASDLGRFVREHEADLVAISASELVDDAALDAAIGAVRDVPRPEDRPVHVLIGGRVLERPGGQAPGADWSGTSLAAAARHAAGIAASLARGR